MTKRSSTTCHRTKNLLLEKNPEEFTEEEKKRLLQHLVECESCRALQEEIKGLYETFSVPASSPLKPSPDIRKRALAHLKSLKRTPRTTINNLFHDFLKIKIPAYQAAFGLILLVITLSVIQLRRSSEVPPSINRKASHGYSRSARLPDQMLAILDSVQTFKIGRNILEDSALFGIVALSISEHDVDSSTMDTVRTDSL